MFSCVLSVALHPSVVSLHCQNLRWRVAVRPVEDTFAKDALKQAEALQHGSASPQSPPLLREYSPPLVPSNPSIGGLLLGGSSHLVSS